MRKVFRWFLWLLLALVVLVAVALTIAPAIATNYLNDHGEELTGRSLQIENIDINYFAGSVTIDRLLLCEHQSTDTFLYVASLAVDVDIAACLNEYYVVEGLDITDLRCTLALRDSTFNFQSLIDHFAATDSVPAEPEPVDSSVTRYGVHHFALANSRITYIDNNIGSTTTVQALNLALPEGLYWNDPNLHATLDFALASGGTIATDVTYQLEESHFDAQLDVNALNLEMLHPYVADFMHIKGIGGALEVAANVAGSTSGGADIDVAGKVRVHDLFLEDTLGTRVASLEALEINIDSLNPGRDVIALRSIHIDAPYLYYEAWADDDNISRMLVAADSVVVDSAGHTMPAEEDHDSNVFVLLRDAIKGASHGIRASNFVCDTLAITAVALNYVDHSLRQPFAYKVSETNVFANGVRRDADSVIVHTTALLNNAGTMQASAVLHPSEPDNVTVALGIEKMPMKDLTAYFYEYLAYPVIKGKTDLQCDVRVKDHQLTSLTDINVHALTLGKKQPHDSAYNVPIKLGIAMLRDRHGTIPLSVPVEGDLSDPDYKVGKAEAKIFKELLVKAASSPYKAIASKLDPDEDASRKVAIKQMTDTLNAKQLAKLDRLAKLLMDKPELALLMTVYYDSEKERRELALLEAKAAYLGIEGTAPFGTTQVNAMLAITTKDTLFAQQLGTGLTAEQQQLPPEEQALLRASDEALNHTIDRLTTEHLNNMHQYLLQAGVPPMQLEALIANTPEAYGNTKTKQVQFQLQFDVLDVGVEPEPERAEVE